MSSRMLCVQDYDLFTVALAFGVLFVMLAHTLHHTSGGELNPAITCALVSGGYLPLPQGLMNIFAQMLGAVVGSLLLRTLLPRGSHSDLGLNFIPGGGDSRREVLQALFAEVVGTFVLVHVYLECKLNPKSKAKTAFPAAAGIALFLAILVLAPVSSGSFNPARSFGPALVSWHFRSLWVFIVGPILGALLAVPAHMIFVAEWDTFADFPNRNQIMGGSTEESEALVPTSTGNLA